MKCIIDCDSLQKGQVCKLPYQKKKNLPIVLFLPVTRFHFFLSDSYPEEINMTQNGCCVQLKKKGSNPHLKHKSFFKSREFVIFPRSLSSQRPWYHVREWKAIIEWVLYVKSLCIHLTTVLKMEVSRRKSNS